MLMSTESQLAELERRHRDLEREIADAEGHPGTDTLILTTLKRRKLQLKDEITKLKEPALH
jgi:hypothetical protein